MEQTNIIGTGKMTVNNRFSILLAEKSIKLRKRVTIADVSRETKLPERTLQAWARNEVTRYDAHVIEALCEYFGCRAGDLIEYIPESETKKGGE